jgi:hypothetical protein
VIVFTPIASAIFGIVHAAAPVALPDIAIDDDAVDHVTEIVPDPPVAAPVRFTVEAVVVAAVALTVRVNGPIVGEVGAGVGVGVGAGVGAGATEPLCAAYIVWIAAMSPAARPVTCL